MSMIRLTGTEVSGTGVRYLFEYDDDLRRFFTGDPLRVEYNIDVASVPSSILVAPWLGSVCPVAWAAGADVSVPVADRTLLQSLRSVREEFTEMYPEFMDGGTISSDQEVDTDSGGEGAAMLFTGGVDSLSTYVRHRREDPTLVTVRGADLLLGWENAWEYARREVDRFGEQHDVETVFVMTNMRGFTDNTMLLSHFQRYLNSNWYASVQQGLALLTLCAPIAIERGIDIVYIAASQWEGVEKPNSTVPEIDENVAWAGTRVEHDGFELSRQERLGIVADFIADQAPDLQIRSCHATERGGNCMNCEKCVRTAVGLLLEGLDPNHHGFELSEGDFERFIGQFESGAWEIGVDERPSWIDIKRHSSPDIELPYGDATTFFEWLHRVDVDELVAESEVPTRHRLLHAVARTIPYPVYEALYPVYERSLKESTFAR